MKHFMLALIALCLFTGRAAAWGHRGFSGCAHAANGYADGCLLAPHNAQYLAPTAPDSFGGTSFYGYAAQSGQTWTSAHPWAWDQACIDYGCGPVQTQAASLDPATLPTSNAVCIYKSFGWGPSYQSPYILCSAHNANTIVDLEGYNFGLHNCIALVIDSTITIIKLANNYYKNGTGCDLPYHGEMLYIEGGSATLDIESSLFDGNYPNFTNTNFGSGHGGQGPIGSINDARNTCPSGTTLIEYTALINSPQRPISSQTCGNRLMQYVYFGAWGIGPGTQHQEVVQDTTPANTPIASTSYSYVAIFQPRVDLPNGGAAGIAVFSVPPGVGVDPTTITYANVNLDHSLLLGNLGVTAGRQPISRGFWVSYNVFGTVNIDKNYVDPTGMFWAFSSFNSPTSTYATAPIGITNWHGNNSVDVLDGLSCAGYDVAYPQTTKPCGH